MSRIDELIQQYCPDGVPFRTLGQSVLRNLGGGTPSRSQASFWDGDIPWASVGDITSSEISIDSTRQFISQEGLKNCSTNLIPRGHVVVAVKIKPGAMRVVETPIAINQDIRALELRDDLDPYFLTYYFATLNVLGNGTIVQGITNSTLEKILTPVPPIEVQREIVDILDRFTQLEAELESELEARRKQYEHYRGTILAFADETVGTEWVTIGDVCSTFSGDFVKRTKQDDSFEFPVYNGGSRPTGFYSDFNSPANSIAISARGSIGFVNWVETKFWAGNSCHVVVPTDERLSNRFLFHYLKFHEPDLYALRAVGSIPALNLKPLLAFRVPLPDMHHQNHIVETLDYFDSLINDISVGLPAEIEARRKQYEYYRDRLLTFKVLDVA